MQYPQMSLVKDAVHEVRDINILTYVCGILLAA